MLSRVFFLLLLAAAAAAVEASAGFSFFQTVYTTESSTPDFLGTAVWIEFSLERLAGESASGLEGVPGLDPAECVESISVRRIHPFLRNSSTPWLGELLTDFEKETENHFSAETEEGEVWRAATITKGGAEGSPGWYETLLSIRLEVTEECLQTFADPAHPPGMLQTTVHLWSIRVLEQLLELPEQSIQAAIASPAAILRGNVPYFAAVPPKHAFRAEEGWKGGDAEDPVQTLHGRPSSLFTPTSGTHFLGAALIQLPQSADESRADPGDEFSDESEGFSGTLSFIELEQYRAESTGIPPTDLSNQLFQIRQQRWSGSAVHSLRGSVVSVRQNLRLEPTADGKWRIQFSELFLSDPESLPEPDKQYLLHSFPDASLHELKTDRDNCGLRIERILRGEVSRLLPLHMRCSADC